MKLRKSYTIIILIISLFLFPAKASAEPTTFSAENAFQHIKYLTQTIGPRPAGSKSEIKAAQYIYYILQQNGWKVHEQPFSKVIAQNNPLSPNEQKIQVINSQNLIAELPGESNETIVIGAHYDSADFNAPGAIDNASGTGVLLELARVLAQEKHQQTYQLVFFGAEEAGLVGSSYYASQADLSAVNWMLNLDMIGTPLEIDAAGKKSAPIELSRQVIAITRADHIPFHFSRDFMVMTRNTNQGGSSDFSPFLDQGIPALGFGIAGRPAGYFHRPEDGIEQISLEELSTIGNLAKQLIEQVHLDVQGPRTWDELYLSFQIGSWVILLPTIILRVFTLSVLLIACYLIVRLFKNKTLHNWKSILITLFIVLLLAIITIGISGAGELLWHKIKGINTLWFAYPGTFLVVRIFISLSFIIFIGNYLKILPLARNPRIYWFGGFIILFLVSFVLALIRVDLAFPFIFWLLIFILQFFVPNIIFVLIGPYFIYSFHRELLESQQWLSYYNILHKYNFIFLTIYSLLSVPMLLGFLHVLILNRSKWIKRISYLKVPAIVSLLMFILCLGLIPNYTQMYPQIITVREEWNDTDQGYYNILSNDKLPLSITNYLNSVNEQNVKIPILNEKPPLSIQTVISEQNNDKRELSISLSLKYTTEPYFLRLVFESNKPYTIKQINEFIPLAKLPRSIKLEGKLIDGKYILYLERTPPQPQKINLTIEADTKIVCTVEAVFPDLDKKLVIKENNVSVDYQSVVRKSLKL